MAAEEKEMYRGFLDVKTAGLKGRTCPACDGRLDLQRT
jgi:hypothetical protein